MQVSSFVPFYRSLETPAEAFAEQLRALNRPGDAKKVEAAWWPFCSLYRRYFRHDPCVELQFELPDMFDDGRDISKVLGAGTSLEWGKLPEVLTAYAAELCGVVGSIVESLEPSRLRVAKSSDHSTDFRSLKWRGRTYPFTAKQAPIVKLLYENWSQGTPDVGDETLLAAVDSEAPPPRLNSLFRGNPAWNTVIVAGATKGTHRLSGEPPKTT